MKNLYEGDFHSGLVTLLKTQFTHKRFSRISNGENKEQRILERNFLKVLFLSEQLWRLISQGRVRRDRQT